MTVLQFHPRAGTTGPAGGRRSGSSGPPRARVRGSFTTPDLGRGTLEGWLRLLHCSVEDSGPRCLAAVSGMLYDAAGERLGVASTRCLVPVRIDPDVRGRGQVGDVVGRVLVGPLEVTLLGFRVRLDQARLVVTSAPDGTAAVPGAVRRPTLERRA